MRKLKLPVIREDLPKGRSLSMEEYIEFVEFNLKYFFDQKAYRRMKASEPFYGPAFKLK
ncbi:MAG: hypothetical protein HY586_04265 [Candidatus Omnitrophica bacterium]|nr:hypothetical protein [Candidatus Omnitrophota bacterium]